jgi:DNA-binding MarR family transcriptional regulator
MHKRKPYYSLESLEPNRSIGFLMKRCGVLMSQVAERRFQALSISFTQWLALIGLAQHEHVSATALSEQLGHDMGACTRVVDELERRGLARRERSRRDRRAVEIAITPEGRRHAQEGKRLIVELLNELVEPFSEQEIETLIGLMQRLHRHLQQAAGTATAAPSLADLEEAPRTRRKASTES